MSTVRGYVATLLNALPFGVRGPVQHAFDAVLGEQSGVTAGTYGSASKAPVLTIDSRGRVTAATVSNIRPDTILARVSHSVATNTNSGSTARLVFDTDTFVSKDGLHSTSVNASRVNFTSSGVYIVSGCVQWSSNTAGTREVRIVLNGSLIVAASRVGAHADPVEQTVTASFNINSTSSYAELEVLQTSGSTLSVLAASAYSPTFSVTQIRS
jgi:hypothetical protein